MLTVYIHFCSLAEALDMHPPVMPEDGHTTRVTTGSDFTPEKESSAMQFTWDDEDTKAFYESLPDLRFFLALTSYLLLFKIVQSSYRVVHFLTSVSHLFEQSICSCCITGRS